MRKYNYMFVMFLFFLISAFQVWAAFPVFENGKTLLEQQNNKTSQREVNDLRHVEGKLAKPIMGKVGKDGHRTLEIGEKAIISIEYYNVVGVRLSNPQKGLNIVKKILSDGSTITTKVLF